MHRGQVSHVIDVPPWRNDPLLFHVDQTSWSPPASTIRGDSCASRQRPRRFPQTRRHGPRVSSSFGSKQLSSRHHDDRFAKL